MSIKFIIDNPYDVIQECMVKGVFYEQDQLEFIKSQSTPGWVIADIGANIGNHTIYFDKFLQPSKIYTIEPSPKAIAILLQNIAINYCHSVNVDYLGVGFAHTTAKASSFLPFGENNQGALTLQPDDNGTIQVIPGDVVFENIKVDFMKIDVETMEMFVLEGLKKTITKCKPKIFIEIDHKNKTDFEKWLIVNDYSVVRCYNNNVNDNWFVVPNHNN